MLLVQGSFFRLLLLVHPTFANPSFFIAEACVRQRRLTSLNTPFGRCSFDGFRETEDVLFSVSHHPFSGSFWLA